MGVGVGQFLRQAALRWPERTGVVELRTDGRRTWSYAQLESRARAIAAALRSRGIGGGARVALCAANSAEFVAAWFGAQYAGAALVPLPILSSAFELRHRLAHAGCRAVLVDEARLAVAEAAGACPCLAIGALESRGEVVEAIERRADDAALLLFTSGTTGRPRAALVSHGSLVSHTAALALHTLALRGDDCVFGALPLTHSFGCRMVMLASLFAGAPMVLTPRFDAEASLRAIDEERVTRIPAVPTMFAAWVRLGRALESGRVRWCLCAGAPLPSDLAVRAERLLGAEVRQGYGMTEASISTVNAPPDARVLGSVGRPVWGVEVRIADPHGRALGAGVQGEVLVRGTNVMVGYDGDAEASAQVLRGGWMHSGDLGRLDEEGRLYVVDRLKDLIVRGGHKIAPSEIEEVLTAHRDVAAAVAVGRPDAYYGEEIVAVIVPQAAGVDAAGLFAWARERLGPAKYPREIALVDQLPVGPSGKVLRRELRRMVADREVALIRSEAAPREGAGPAPNDGA